MVPGVIIVNVKYPHWLSPLVRNGHNFFDGSLLITVNALKRSLITTLTLSATAKLLYIDGSHFSKITHCNFVCKFSADRGREREWVGERQTDREREKDAVFVIFETATEAITTAATTTKPKQK